MCYRFEGNLRIYVLSDDICPFCNEKLFPYTVKYCRKVKGVLCEETVKWFTCKSCHHKFATDNQIENFYPYNTDICFDKKYYDKSHCCDAIVVFNVNKCSKHNHKFEELICDLPIINKDGDLEYKIVDIIHCITCNRYIMLKSTYDNLGGTPTCPIINETYNDSNGYTENDFYYGDKEGSKLRQYGYNVNCNDKLPIEQRHKILLVHLLTNDITKGEIYSILDTNINRGQNRKNTSRDWSKAVQKWKDDKKYVQELDLEKESKHINVNKIILKFHNKPKQG